MDLTYTYSLLRGKRYELGAGREFMLLEAEASAECPEHAEVRRFLRRRRHLQRWRSMARYLAGSRSTGRSMRARQ